MHIVVNGEPKEFVGGTVIDLLKSIGLGDQLVAVEINRAIVKRAEHASTPVREGDAIEIVHLVGGG